MDLLFGWADERCEDTVAGKSVLLIGYTLPWIEFQNAFRRANLYKYPDSIIAEHIPRVAKKEADIWMECMKKELADIPRGMEVLLAAAFLMCRHMEMEGDKFEVGDLRRVFYGAVHDELVSNERFAEELKQGTEILKEQHDSL